MARDAIFTNRLELQHLTGESMAALLDGNAKQLTVLTNANFPLPVRLPPMFDEHLPMLREQLQAHNKDIGWQWWPWLILNASDKAPLGIAGFNPIPDNNNVVEVGYSIYPEFQRQGFATEAVAALIAWIFLKTKTVSVRANIPCSHLFSIRVAEKVGMQQVGRDQDPDVGEIVVFEISKNNLRDSAN